MHSFAVSEESGQGHQVQTRHCSSKTERSQISQSQLISLGIWWDLMGSDGYNRNHGLLKHRQCLARSHNSSSLLNEVSTVSSFETDTTYTSSASSFSTSILYLMILGLLFVGVCHSLRPSTSTSTSHAVLGRVRPWALPPKSPERENAQKPKTYHGHFLHSAASGMMSYAFLCNIARRLGMPKSRRFSHSRSLDLLLQEALISTIIKRFFNCLWVENISDSTVIDIYRIYALLRSGKETLPSWAKQQGLLPFAMAVEPWRGAKHRKNASISQALSQKSWDNSEIQRIYWKIIDIQIPSSRTSSTGTQSALQWQFIHIA